MIVVLFFLMIGDYLLTYWGIHLGIIQEGNGLMTWLMNLPIEYGIMAKIVISGLLLFPIILAKNRRKKIYKYALGIAYCAYFVIFAMHGYWIYLFMTL
jgi:hypothetical protein